MTVTNGLYSVQTEMTEGGRGHASGVIVLRDGTIGFGEAFMEGWLDCERLDLLAERAFRADLSSRFEVRAALVAAIKRRMAEERR